jgi:hypothetical protein
MSDDWREELILRIAERIDEMRLFLSTNTETARAVLAVAEPVLREQCAGIAYNKVLTYEDCCYQTGKEIAAALQSFNEEKLNSEPYTCELIAKTAADEITILRGQVEALDNERNRLWSEKLQMQGENARLREALKPFVPETQWIDPDIPNTRPIDVMVLARELRAARAAIREGGEDD